MAQRPESTVKKTQYDMNVWRRYLDSINERREVENIPSDELNVLMCRFFMSVKKKDGSHYEPVSLTSFHRSLQHFLNDKGSPLNLLKDQQFKKSREVLSSKKKQLVENVKENRPQAARELTAEDERQTLSLRQVWRLKSRSSAENSMVAPLTTFWLSCTRREQAIKVGRRKALERLNDWQQVLAVGSRKRIKKQGMETVIIKYSTP